MPPSGKFANRRVRIALTIALLLPALPALLLPAMLIPAAIGATAKAQTRADAGNKATAPTIGQPPPDALGRDREGQEQTVSRHRGKVVIVTFWASWCGPCRKELPILGKFQRIIGRDHLEVIAINVKEPRADYQAVIRANRDIDVTWVHDSSGATSVQYGVDSLPNMFVIDREGRVAYAHRGYSEEKVPVFVRQIAALLPPEVLARPAGE
jgi:thiol-disulfide isomerase/thioredoxin